MTTPRILHKARGKHVEDGATFRTPFTLCAPTGTLTDGGGDRTYESTDDMDKVNCSRCLTQAAILEAIRERMNA